MAVTAAMAETHQASTAEAAAVEPGETAAMPESSASCTKPVLAVRAIPSQAAAPGPVAPEALATEPQHQATPETSGRQAPFMRSTSPKHQVELLNIHFTHHYGPPTIQVRKHLLRL